MRFLLCTSLVLAACGRDKTARDTMVGDTTVGDTTTASASPQTQAISPLPDRMLGMWAAKGYDAGSSRAQQFTINWARASDGSLAGTVAFHPGETYSVKVVSTGDSTITYESEPHMSPTLKTQVVTRTQARLVGDSLMGTYEARAQKGGKVLKGRFSAQRGSAPSQ